MHSVITSIRSGLLYSNVIVTVAAATMAFRTFRLAGLAVDPWVISLIAAATLAVYALHSLTPDERPGSARDVWNRRARTFHRLCLTASLIIILLLFPKIIGHVIVFLPAVLLTGYYMSATILKFPIHGKTLVLALTWTYATMLMPLLMSVHHIDWQIMLPESVLEFIYIYLICLFFDHRDASVDEPRHWTFRTPKRICAVILVTAIAFTMVLAWAWVAGVPYQWLIVKSLLMIFLTGTSDYSLRNSSDGWYYGVLDGMLAFDALCLCCLMD
jgi:hypothetical protein